MVWKKLNLMQQKDAYINQKKCTTIQNKHKKLKPGLVAFYDIQYDAWKWGDKEK